MSERQKSHTLENSCDFDPRCALIESFTYVQRLNNYMLLPILLIYDQIEPSILRPHYNRKGNCKGLRGELNKARAILSRFEQC